MSEKQLLLLLLYMTLSTWLEYKSISTKDHDAQVGWWALNWITACLYTNQFATLLKSIDYLKDLEDWIVLLLSFLILVAYGQLVGALVKASRRTPFGDE